MAKEKIYRLAEVSVIFTFSLLMDVSIAEMAQSSSLILVLGFMQLLVITVTYLRIVPLAKNHDTQSDSQLVTRTPLHAGRKTQVLPGFIAIVPHISGVPP